MCTKKVQHYISKNFICAIGIDKENYSKFFKYLKMNKIRYDCIKIIENVSELCDFVKCGTEVDRGFKEYYFDTSKNSLIFIPYSIEEWKIEIENKIKQHKRDLLSLENRLKCITGINTQDQELIDNTLISISWHTRRIEHYFSMLKINPKQYLENGTEEIKNIEERFERYKNYCNEDFKILLIGIIWTFRVNDNIIESDIVDIFIEKVKENKIDIFILNKF